MSIFLSLAPHGNAHASTPQPLHPKADGEFALTAIAVCAILIGVVCSTLLVSLYIRFVNFRKGVRNEASRAADAIRLRELILNAGSDSVVVIGHGADQPFSIGHANGMLQQLMSGADAGNVAHAISCLVNSGTAFQISARNPQGNIVSLRGKPAGKRAIVFLRDLGLDDSVDYRGILEALSIPVWSRGHDLTLKWANQAYLDIARCSSLDDARRSNTALEKSEPGLAEAALGAIGPIVATRYVLAEGRRRAIAMEIQRLSDGTVFGAALDTTAVAQAEARLRLFQDATDEVLEELPAGVAIFGKDKRIARYNIRYAQTWDLNPDWLDTHPTFGEIIDRLRQTRQLPEQADFQSWKQNQLAKFETCKAPECEFLHLRGGKSIRVRVCPHMEGGLFFVVEDVSEKLKMEASIRLLTQVQRATLDALDDAIAIFAPDGHLMLHNKGFSRLWKLSEEELADQPHFRKIAGLCESRIGHDEIWSIVAAGVTSNEPERCADWGRTPRADGRSISLAMSRLPNGATVVTFTDLTDIDRFHAAQLEASHAA